MSDEAKVGIVLVSHSAALAEGTAELAGQIGGGTVAIATAGGTDDGRIGTSLAKVQRALALADAGAGVVILPDLGSSVLTVRALLAESEDLPEPIAVAAALDNALNENELREFDGRVNDLLRGAKRCYVAELKLDGLSMAAHYRDGKFVQAVTRCRRDQIVIDLVRLPVPGSLLQADYRGICW